MLHGMGIETGVDLAAVTAATHYLAAQLGLASSSKYVQAVAQASS
jgi:hydroxymethylglutaryl-CoA lyase